MTIEMTPDLESALREAGWEPKTDTIGSSADTPKPVDEPGELDFDDMSSSEKISAGLRKMTRKRQ